MNWILGDKDVTLTCLPEFGRLYVKKVKNQNKLYQLFSIHYVYEIFTSISEENKNENSIETGSYPSSLPQVDANACWDTRLPQVHTSQLPQDN